jgi:hypothetical protein
MHLDRSADNVERYKVAKKTAKRAMSEARGQKYDGLYQRLGMKEGEKDIYTKSRERKTRDIIQVKCIKDETERLLDGNKSLYLVFVGVVFFSASWTAFRAVRTASWTG